MKKYISIALCVALVALSASSCDKLLKPESPSTYDEETVFSNYDLAESAVFGVVQALGIDKSYRNRFLVWYGFNTDIEWYNTYNPGGDKGKTDITIYNCLPDNQELGDENGCYTQIYLAVERANLAVAGLRKYGNVEQNKDMAYLLGEVLTLRAMLYYDLCKAWGDVPARFEPVTTETIYLPKSSRDVIFKQILSDLDTAVDYLDYPGTTVRTSRTDRVNKVFAEGLYARIALMAAGSALRPADGQVGTGDVGSIRTSTDPDLQPGVLYPKALRHLKDAIANGGCALDPDYEAYWKRQSARQNIRWDGETLYVIPFGSGRGQWNNYFALRAETGSRYNTYSGNRGGSAGPVPYVYWMYDSRDQRRDITCVNYKWDKEDKLSPAGPADWYFGKYRFEWGDAPASANDDGVKPVVMRYSDVLLMAAEIANELQNMGSAEATLDDAKGFFKPVRERAFPGNESVADAYVDALGTYDAFKAAIIDERALEFCGEFLRKADLIRWGLLKKNMDKAKDELRALRDHTGKYATVGSTVYYKFDDAQETIQLWGYNPGETTAPAGSGWDSKSDYFSKVKSSDNKDTGLYEGRINGIYHNGDQVEWYMYWPIFSKQITNSQNYLVNDYYYE